MAGIDADIWVCGECRSINNLRARQCYHCRTPRDVAAVDPSQIEGTGHGKLREIALPGFRSSRGAAWLASAMLILVAVTQVVSTVSDAIVFGRVARDPALLTDPAFARSVESLVAGTVALATLGVAAFALVAWAFWLSRAVETMPALGLGYPAANGLMAFVENFLPGLNLFRVPAIVRDIVRRLDPGSLRGEALIFAAWIGLLGGYLVPRFGSHLELLGSGTLEEIVRETLLVQAVATVLVVVGAAFLVALIWWIERRIALRRAAQLAGEPSPVAADVGAVPAMGAADAALRGDASVAARPSSAGPAVAAPASPSGAAVPVAPVAQEGVAAPVGSIASRAESGTFASRSITAATGAATILTPPPATAAQAPSSSPPSARDADPDAPSATEPPPPPELPRAEQTPGLPPAEQTPAVPPPVVPPPAAPPPAGPRLDLRIEENGSMIATLEGASEPITIGELRAAAVTLARVNGSTVIETVSATFAALSVAEQAFDIFSDAGVPTTVKD